MLAAELGSVIVTQVVLVFKSLKGSWKEAEAWQHVSRLESLKKGQKSPIFTNAASGTVETLAYWGHQD